MRILETERCGALTVIEQYGTSRLCPTPAGRSWAKRTATG